MKIYTNQAIHIVTNDKNYKTESGNFNFIFSFLAHISFAFNVLILVLNSVDFPLGLHE